MKNLPLKTSVIASIILASVMLLTPAPAHASIFGDSFFKEKIDASKGNISQNRDNRNLLLEKIKADKQMRLISPAERQTALLQQLSVTISNFQNIHDRIQLRVDGIADDKDISDVQYLLSSANDELSLASTTVATITASIASTSASRYDARLDIANVINLVNVAKITLQQALDNLQQIL